MGVRAMDMEGTARREDLDIGRGGVVTVLNDASIDGAMLLV